VAETVLIPYMLSVVHRAAAPPCLTWCTWMVLHHGRLNAACKVNLDAAPSDPPLYGCITGLPLARHAQAIYHSLLHASNHTLGESMPSAQVRHT
jgi:hypothetical protein